VDTAWFNPNHIDGESVRAQWQISGDAWVFVTVAALEERKGIQHVIQLMANLKAEGYSIHYFVVGDGPYHEELEALVKEKELTAQVHFTGSVKEVRPYYKAADISFLLAYGEGLPNTLLESWAMATPIVVSHYSPFPDLVDNHTALMVNEKDADMLKKRVTQLLEHPEKRQQLAENGKQLVKEQYSWQAVARQYLSSVEKSEKLNLT
jgi:glycosyltransferase involved in cell wall biosynthesis